MSESVLSDLQCLTSIFLSLATIDGAVLRGAGLQHVFPPFRWVDL